MFCIQCGHKVTETGKFCANCGQAVQRSTGMSGGQKEAAAAAAVGMGAVQPKKQKNSTTFKMWIAPLLAAVVVCLGLVGDYTYQRYVNKKAEELRIAGESLALEGNIAAGKEKIADALRKRPNSPVLQTDMEVLRDAAAIDEAIKEAHEFSAKNKPAEALQKIEQAKKDLNNRKGSLYTMLSKQVQKEEAVATIAQIKSEMSAKKTIDELIPLLTKLDNFNEEEAKKAKLSIQGKISDIAYNNASKALREKDFTLAANVVDEALKYDSRNKKLVSFKETINQNKASFERAEQKRMEAAMEAAAAEEMKNRTQAVELVSVNSGIDMNGDFTVTGEVRNVATRPIASIRLYYDILDSAGQTVSTGSTYVYPILLDVGSTGNFEDTQYNTGDMASVHITRVEWNLN
jgi:hypothetical protein